MKKIIFTGLTALMMCGTFIVNAQTCSIGSVNYATLDDALAAVTTGQTIKLLANIDYAKGITVNGISIAFDMNGFNLNVTNTGGIGLNVTNSGKVNMASYINGQLNITGSSEGVHADGGCAANVTNATSTGSPNKAAAGSNGGIIYVFGNLTAVANDGLGAIAANGGTITVNGAINVPATATYIMLQSTVKTAADFTEPTTLSDFLTYTNGSSMVWVKGQAWHIGWPNAADVTATLSGSSPNYTLTISGTGAMRDFTSGSVPWNSVSSSITSVVIEQGVISIGYASFEGCSDLTSVSIPNSVTLIGLHTFANCSGLTSITCLNPVPGNITLGGFVFDGVNKTTCILYVPAGSYTTYRDADQWKDFTHINETTGIAAVEIPNLKLYPNPVKDALYITAESAIDKVEIYDVNGRAVMTTRGLIPSPQQTINVSSLAPGVYAVKVYAAQGAATRKIIKN